MMKKTKFPLRADLATDPATDMEDSAIRSDKGIAFKSPDGSIWLLQVDDAGTVTATKKV